MRSRTGSVSQIPTLARAAAQQIGFAVKLEEWKNVFVRSSDRCASNMRGVQSVAASGSVPPVSPLAVHRMSGVICACSQAKSVPVRPQPVITSSAMRSAPWASQMRRISASTDGE